MSIDQFRAKLSESRNAQDHLSAMRVEAPERILAGLRRMEARIQEIIQQTPELKSSVSTKIYPGRAPHDPAHDYGYMYYPDNGPPPQLGIVTFARWTIMSLTHNPYTDRWFKQHDEYPYESEQTAYDAILAILVQWVANYPKHLEENARAEKFAEATREADSNQQFKIKVQKLKRWAIILLSFASLSYYFYYNYIAR